MKDVVYNVDHPQVQLTLVLKLFEMRHEQSIELEYEQFERVFSEIIWKQNSPKNLSIAINDILSIKLVDVYRYLQQLETLDMGGQLKSEYQGI